MKLTISCFTFFTAVLFLFAGFSFAQNESGLITAKAVWNPDINVMQEIQNNCGKSEQNATADCLTGIMMKNGASAQALNFTRDIGTVAYMNGFKELGNIDAAFVYFPLRSYDREDCLLVNGNPRMIDINDFDLLPFQEMQQDSLYIELEKKYPHINIFPGNFRGTDYPYAKGAPHHGTRIVVDYRLRNGCYSCQLVGFAEFGFDFDSTGNYIGNKFLSIKSVENENKQAVSSENPSNYFSDPEQPINVYAGEKFTITLVSNHSQGFKWQLDGNLDSSLVSLEGTDFTRPYETLPNAAGRELWFFRAKHKGAVKIKLQYIPTWDEGKKPVKTYTFTVNIN